MALRLPQIRETRTVRDSDSGLEQMSIGHHIRDRAHILSASETIARGLGGAAGLYQPGRVSPFWLQPAGFLPPAPSPPVS